MNGRYLILSSKLLGNITSSPIYINNWSSRISNVLSIPQSSLCNRYYNNTTLSPKLNFKRDSNIEKKQQNVKRDEIDKDKEDKEDEEEEEEEEVEGERLSSSSTKINKTRRLHPILGDQFSYWKGIAKSKLSNNDLLKAIKENLWYSPTEIQQHVIPIILDNRNVLVSSKTGSGKTASYILPILNIISNLKNRMEGKKYDITLVMPNINIEDKDMVVGAPLAVVLVPSKELAIQVTKDFDQLNKYTRLRVVSVIGGVGEHTQKEELAAGCHVLVATPGRLLNLIEQKAVTLRNVHVTVVDEFDKLFNMGFFPDTKAIFEYMPRIANRVRGGMQTTLVSATILHDKYDELITRFSPNHTMINLNQDLRAPETVRQHFYSVSYRKKRALLMYFFRRSPASKTSLQGKKVLVFARTQQRVENLKERFMERKIGVICIHADMSMSARNNALIKFREDDELKVLVCTDVMTRGIHIDNLDAVVNYDVPHVSEDYLHRVGRVGRVGREGFSLTFVAREKLVFEVGHRTVGLNENHLITNIETLMGKKCNISKVPGPWEEDNLDESESTDSSFSIKVQDDGREDDRYHQDYDESKVNRFNNRENQRNEIDKEKRYLQTKEKRAVTDMLIKTKVLETFKGPHTRDGLPRVRFNPNAKIKNRKMSKLVVDRKGEIRDLPPITDFESGRYEAVLNEFDQKRARKRGVGLKEKKLKIFTPSRIMTKRQETRLKNQPDKKNNVDDD